MQNLVPHRRRRSRHNGARSAITPALSPASRPGPDEQKRQPMHSGTAIERILLPTDFAPEDSQTLRQAVSMARLFGVELVVLHVIDINDPAWASYVGSSANFMRELRARAHANMQQLLVFLAKEPITVRALLVEGLPPAEILKCARDSSALLVVRRPHPKPFWKLFSKRTAQRVLDEAECAVLVV